MMDHITEIENPSMGKANKAEGALPRSAKNKHKIVVTEAPISSFLLSIIFSKASPKRQPKVSIAQK